jgi:heme-degrading monooxygenase HmoA|tara:strand:+ start:8231 stop:8533 length:303 start_codon:yes stop_codon:yes gene_type:complete
MVTEHVLIKIRHDSTQDFIAAMESGQEILEAADGARAVRLLRGIEDENQFLLTIEWDSVEHHVAFTKTEGFARFGALVGKYFAEKPAMQHFDGTLSRGAD